MGRAYEVRKASIQKTGAARGKIYTTFAKEIFLSFPFSTNTPQSSSKTASTDLLTPLFTLTLFNLSPFFANCLNEKLLKVIFGNKTEITTKEMKKNARSSYDSVVNYLKHLYYFFLETYLI